LCEPPEDYVAPKRKAPPLRAEDVLPSQISGIGQHAKGTDHYKIEFNKVQAENIFPLQNQGSNCNAGLMPSIIKEIYFQPDSPLQVQTLIESALVYQNVKNWKMALDCFDQAREQWKKELTGPKKELKKEQELFFELSIASIYEGQGLVTEAIKQYMKAKEIKLPYNHPDLAFAYCGLGSAFYELDEPEWSLRFYLAARKIRESTIGGDTVDSGAVYNNLGCCMYRMERNEEAKAFFELTDAIFQCELGPDHERSLVSRRNIQKVNRANLRHVPEYRQQWSTNLPHPNPKESKKKKKKGKKKK